MECIDDEGLFLAEVADVDRYRVWISTAIATIIDNERFSVVQ
jgi:hypothetical protein